MNRFKEEELFKVTEQYVRDTLRQAEAGHNWQHTERVVRLSGYIGKQEMADMFVCHMGALLHDIADHKFHQGGETKALELSEKHLKSLKLHKSRRKQILFIVKYVSYSSKPPEQYPSLELQVVQDADRLDAMGAIGIARAFQYGGFKNRELFLPDVFPGEHLSPEECRNRKGTTVNHFFEKLLLLRDGMNTDTGKLLSIERHEYMKYYLKHLLREWYYPDPVPEEWLRRL